MISNYFNVLDYFKEKREFLEKLEAYCAKLACHCGASANTGGKTRHGSSQ